MPLTSVKPLKKVALVEGIVDYVVDSNNCMLNKAKETMVDLREMV